MAPIVCSSATIGMPATAQTRRAGVGHVLGRRRDQSGADRSSAVTGRPGACLTAAAVRGLLGAVLLDPWAPGDSLVSRRAVDSWWRARVLAR
jgi:hypothetical protein